MNKPAFFIILLICALLAVVRAGKKEKRQNSVNPLIGDVSYVQRFGKTPGVNTNEDVRIRTHLMYVAGLLREKTPSGLSAQALINRQLIITHLRDYITKGEFPRNSKFPDKRVPCFIDQDNRICAVGYLVEKTAGRTFAEKINTRYQYNTIHEMDPAVLQSWLDKNGITLEECAMIQPQYGGWGPVYPTNNVEPAYGITSAVFTGFNLSLSAFTLARLNHSTRNKVSAIAGITGGSLQTALGVYEIATNTGYYNAHALSYLNIGIGSGTIMMGVMDLLLQQKQKKVQVGAFSNSTPMYRNAGGLRFSFKF